MVDVSERVMSSEYASLVKELNPNFQVPKKPFRRMDYAEAIEYLKANEITKDDGSYYEFGEVDLHFFVNFSSDGLLVCYKWLKTVFQDIPEAPERKMTDKINEPIMLTRFPGGIKAFYMQPCPEDKRLTESVTDVLISEIFS